VHFLPFICLTKVEKRERERLNMYVMLEHLLDWRIFNRINNTDNIGIQEKLQAYFTLTI
jgi:hypothetical protein